MNPATGLPYGLAYHPTTNGHRTITNTVTDPITIPGLNITLAAGQELHLTIH